MIMDHFRIAINCFYLVLVMLVNKCHLGDQVLIRAGQKSEEATVWKVAAHEHISRHFY